MSSQEPQTDLNALRANLRSEYEALMKVISEFDGRLMLVKGWSVTLSLAGLGLGFSQQHYALFALSSVTAFAFWCLDWVMKRHQMMYYARMRDIEVASYHLDHLHLSGQMVSSPKVDWSWGFKGNGQPWPDRPRRRDAANIRQMIRRAPWMGHVLLPHAVAVALGLILFFLALMDVPAFADLKL
jgi:hypothetical protein